MSGPVNRREAGHRVTDKPGAAGKGKPTLDRAIQARIGDKLRSMYGELSEQPVPDRLTAILHRLGKD